MKKVKFISIVVCLLATLLLTSIAHAALDLIGQGTSVHGTWNLIYDTDLDITWYDYTSTYKSWGNQMAWANALTVNFGGTILDDWRLPSANPPCAGYCPGSEMGHLYDVELDRFLQGTGDFQNLYPVSEYWSGTETTFDTSAAYFTKMDAYGWQRSGFKGGQRYALAVRSGLAVVPEPISSILFVIGGVILAGKRYIIRKRGLI